MDFTMEDVEVEIYRWTRRVMELVARKEQPVVQYYRRSRDISSLNRDQGLAWQRCLKA